jgi:hypothetical protein
MLGQDLPEKHRHHKQQILVCVGLALQQQARLVQL